MWDTTDKGGGKRTELGNVWSKHRGKQKKDIISSYFQTLSVPLRKKQALFFIISLFVWLKQIKVIHPGNKWDLLWGCYQISSGTSSLTARKLSQPSDSDIISVSIPCSHWWKDFIMIFWETISSLYFILRKEGMCLFSVSNKK